MPGQPSPWRRTGMRLVSGENARSQSCASSRSGRGSPSKTASGPDRRARAARADRRSRSRGCGSASRRSRRGGSPAGSRRRRPDLRARRPHATVDELDVRRLRRHSSVPRHTTRLTPRSSPSPSPLQPLAPSAGREAVAGSAGGGCGGLTGWVAGRISSAARSAIMIVGAFVLPRTIVGITDASATRRPSTPRTRS